MKTGGILLAITTSVSGLNLCQQSQLVVTVTVTASVHSHSHSLCQQSQSQLCCSLSTGYSSLFIWAHSPSLLESLAFALPCCSFDVNLTWSTDSSSSALRFPPPNTLINPLLLNSASPKFSGYSQICCQNTTQVASCPFPERALVPFPNLMSQPSPALSLSAFWSSRLPTEWPRKACLQHSGASSAYVTNSSPFLPQASPQHYQPHGQDYHTMAVLLCTSSIY